MSQALFNTIDPATTSGPQLATLVNNLKDAIVSGFSGTSRPAALLPGGYWVDITNDLLGTWDYKFFTGSTDIKVFTLNKNTGIASLGTAQDLFTVSKSSPDAVGPIIRLLKKRGGTGQTLVGDSIGDIYFEGIDQTGVSRKIAGIHAVVENNTSASAQGAYLKFEVTNASTTTLVEAMRLIDAKVGLGLTAPQTTFHAKGNAKVESISSDAISGKVKLKKKRITGTGQTVASATIGQHEFLGTDDTGAEAPVAVIEVTARENLTSTAQGSKASFKNKKLTQSSYTEQMFIDENGTTIPTLASTTANVTDLTVQNLIVTQNLMGQSVETTDPSIQLNKSGSQASANSATSGIEVYLTSGSSLKFGYNSSKTSKAVIGTNEIHTVDQTQNMENKTFVGASVQDPTLVLQKQDTFSALTTYAATATDGELVYAQDLDKQYVTTGGALVEIVDDVARQYTDYVLQNGKMLQSYEWESIFDVGTGGNILNYTNCQVPTQAPVTPVQAMAFSPDGKLVATGQSSPSYLNLYERQGSFFGRIATYTSATTTDLVALSWSPDSRFLLAGWRTTAPNVSIWEKGVDNNTLTALGALTAAGGEVTSVTWSPNGRFIACGMAVTPFIALYERTATNTFTKLANPTTIPTATVKNLAFTPDGKFLVINYLVASSVANIAIYSVSGNTFTMLADSGLFGDNKGTWNMAVSPIENAFYAGRTTLNKYSISSTGVVTLTLANAVSGFTSGRTKISPTGKYLAISGSGTTRFRLFKFNEKTGIFSDLGPNTFAPAGAGAVDIAWSPDGRFFGSLYGGATGNTVIIETAKVQDATAGRIPRVVARNGNYSEWTP